MNFAGPARFYEPNILRSPFEWMGIWTPHGWRTHRKRFDRAERISFVLPVQAGQTFFPGALRHPDSGRVEWADDLHLRDDPFTDGGIYPCDPRVEYRVGRPRWSVSHSLLSFPVADHSLHTHEYTWNIATGDLATHFRQHIILEEGCTDCRDGRTVAVRCTPISRSIEGNVLYDAPNSAVRGVWDNPEKTGHNLYARRALRRLEMLNGTYVITPERPVLQCRGVWPLFPEDPLDALFDSDGCCLSPENVIEELSVPLDQPKLAMFLPRTERRFSRLYGGEIGMLAERDVTIDEDRIQQLRRRVGNTFDPVRAGYAGGNPCVESPGGYFPEFDFDNDGLIGPDDLELIERHRGRTMRANIYVHSYFGPDWLSICVALDAEQKPGSPVLADYDYGAGYDARSGTISLFETPGPDRPVWVEYFSDIPESDDGEMRITTYRELP